MKINRLILLVCMVLNTSSVWGQVAALDMHAALNAFLEGKRSELAAKGYRSEYEVGNIDPRLKLGECNEALEISINRELMRHSHNTAKIECKAGPNWKIFVSFEFKIFGDTVIARQALSAGKTLTRRDLKISESQINRSNKISYSKPEQIIGMKLKRSLREGLTITPNHIEAPQLVKRGDQVTIVAENDQIYIKLLGTALSGGSEGEQISIKNNRSQRVLRAQIIDKGIVSVRL